MRRVIGLILTGVGTLLVVFAVLLPTWITSQVIKFPLNEYETATLAASNASYFSPSTLTEKTGVNMTATYTIKGKASRGDSSTAVWDEYAYVYDHTNHLVVQQMTRTFAFDRKTGKLVDCCGASVNGDSSVRQRGYVGNVFPIGTKKQTYDVFDTTLNQPVPFTYAGTATVHGIQAYKFTENVPARQIATQTVPGSLVGKSAASVTLPQYYQINLVYYVDPDTGALLNVDEHQVMSLRDPSAGTQALLLFDAHLIATPASVNSIVALDKNGRNELNLLQTILPLAIGILGAITLIAGILLSRRRRPTMDEELDAMSRKLAASG
jgi:Porin PorA